MWILIDYLGTCVTGHVRNRKDVPNCLEVLKEIVENGHFIAFSGFENIFIAHEAYDWVFDREVDIGVVELGYTGGFIIIDDEGIGCPLVDNYVDWYGVRDILIDKGIIFNK